MLMPDADDNAPDVLPPLANRLFALAWILLFGGRWVGGNLLIAAGLLSQPQLSDFDDRILLRVYLALFVVTIAVVALRLARRARPQGASPRREKSRD